MRVFLTGGTGFIGSALIPELTRAGHEVLGLARSEAAARALTAAGAGVHRGDLEDLGSLQSGVARADGVIHAGFQPGFSSFAAASEAERRAVETFGAALAGSDRPLVITSGTAGIQPGRIATEDDATLWSSAMVPRIATEEVATALAERGVRASVGAGSGWTRATSSSCRGRQGSCSPAASPSHRRTRGASKKAPRGSETARSPSAW